MSSKYLYLTLDLLSFLVPFAFSFHPRKPFAPQWKAWLPALVLPGLLFIAWDEWFTSMGVWGFNAKYLTGFHIGHLPLEEIMFFFCIPYACLFTYHAVSHLRERSLPYDGKSVTWVLMVGLAATGIKNYDRWYTVVTCLGLALFLLLLTMRIKPAYLGRYYFSFLFILVPFFLINGILTGSWIDDPVVWYNDEENLGIRMGTIPLEDAFYGMMLTLMNVVIYEERLNRVSTPSNPK
jgi:lycopene cyclase domain-containing protein